MPKDSVDVVDTPIVDSPDQEYADMVDELSEDANDDGVQEPIVEQEAEETPETPEDPVEEDSEEPVVSPDKKDNEAFATMRATNKRLADTLARGAKAAGLSVEDFMAKLEADELEADAKAQAIPVEVLERIRELESRDAARQEEHRNLVFRNQIENFQATMKLSQNDLRDFIGECIGQGIDVGAENTNLELLYKGMNFDKLVEAQKQEWIKRDSKILGISSTPGSGKGQSSGNHDGKAIETQADLDAIFNQM